MPENMSHPGEHKTVQARIHEYAEAVGWTVVSREEEAEQGRPGFPTRRDSTADRNVRPPMGQALRQLHRSASSAA